MAKQRNTLTKEEIILENATEFGKCFILETTTKLLFYNSILKGEVKKKESFSKPFIEQKGLLGGFLCICGFFVPGVKEIASVIKGIAMIAESVENKPYIETNSNLGDLIREILCNAKEFTETLASASINVFQCYEMQFTHVTLNKNAMNAMRILAKDAAERAIEHMIINQNTSFNQSILSGKSKEDGYSIDFKFESSFKCRTSDLYKKPGIVTHSKGQSTIWKRTDGKSEASKYGYRLLSCEEDWNTIKHQYEKDTDAKDHFAQYEYLPNFENIKESILKNVIEKAKEDEMADERIMDILKKTHKEASKLIQNVETSVKDLVECSAEDRKLLDEIKITLSNLNTKEYATKIFKLHEESIERLKEENESNFNQVHVSLQDMSKGNASHHNEAYVHRDQNYQKLNDKIDELKISICETGAAEEESQKNLWFGVLTPVKTFIGREDEMAEMQKDFETSDKGLDAPPIICISGLGGIGKTELARKFAYKHGKEFDENIIWVNAENPATLLKSFLDFTVANFSEVKSKKYEKMDIQNIVQEVYKELNKRRCLFIFDNVESISVFKKLVPHLPSGQRAPCILITSQSKGWKDVKVINLEGLTYEEAADFISNGLELDKNKCEEDIKFLAEKLHCFPLALQQAVAYIKQKCVKKMKYSGTKFDIKDYLKTFDEQTKALLGFECLDDDRYTKTTFTTWKITMDKIKADGEQQSEELLNMLSYFYPDNIKIDLFQGLGVSDDILEEVVSLLERYSMITNKGDCSFNIHRLVQRVVRINLDNEGKEEDVLYKTVNLFSDHIQQEKEYDINWDYERIMHVITSWKYGIKYKEIAKSFSELPKSVLYKLVGEGKFREAADISKISFDAWKKHAIINENTLDVMHWLTVYPDEPIETIRKIDDAIKYLRENLGKLNTNSKSDQNEICSQVGSNEDYLKRTKKLLNKRKYCTGEIKINDINFLNDNITIELCNDFLNDCRATLGDNHSLTLDAMKMIADHLKENKKISEATTAYSEVFNKSREFLGYEYWLTYDAMNNLADIFKDNGKIDDAIGIYQEFVNGCKGTLGLDHELALRVNLKIADLFVRNKNIDEAIKVLEELLNRRLKLDANGLTLNVVGKVAKLFVRQGYLDKAIEAHKELLKEQRGKDQKQTLKTLEVIERLHKQAGNMSEALPVYYEILDLQNHMLGYGNKLILPIMKNIETILTNLGRIEEAIQMYKEQLGHLENTSSDIESSLDIMNNIAILLEKSDEVYEAFEMYISLHKKETEMLGCKNVSFKSLAKIGDLFKKFEPKDKKKWQAMEILANLLRDNGNIEEALGLYLEILSEKKGDALNDIGLNSALMANLTALKQSNLNLVEVEKVYKNVHIDLKESLKQAEEETSAMDTNSALFRED